LLTTVSFDGQPMLETVEVDDVPAYRVLSTELSSTGLPVSQQPP
jgi:hypothetical protein